MAYHRQGATTRLTTDASPVGVGAILEQKQQDGTYRPIYYASRKLSKVEARYSQFEREALAFRWACEKFYLYLYGIKFEIRTDHKPPSAQIERWLLYLQQFQYTLTHGSVDLHTPIHPPPSTCPPCPSIVANDECTKNSDTRTSKVYIC